MWRRHYIRSMCRTYNMVSPAEKEICISRHIPAPCITAPVYVAEAVIMGKAFLFFCARQCYMENIFSASALYTDFSMMLYDNTFCDGQPETKMI